MHSCPSLPVQISPFLQKKLQNSRFLPASSHLPSIPSSAWVAATPAGISTEQGWDRNSLAASQPCCSRGSQEASPGSRPVLLSSSGLWLGTALGSQIEFLHPMALVLRINNNSCSATTNNPTTINPGPLQTPLQCKTSAAVKTDWEGFPRP